MYAETPIEEMKNVAILAHGGGGTTSLCEAMLYNGKETKKIGISGESDTVMTIEPEEKIRGITITPHVGFFNWKKHLINIIDSPGYTNFLESTRGVLCATDSAVMLLSGISGIKAENERLYAMCQDACIPVMGLVNKLDRGRSDYITTLDEIEKSFGIQAVPITYPVGVGEEFRGVVDLLLKSAYDSEGQEISIPEAISKDVEYYHHDLIEKIVETDDDLLESYLEGKIPEITVLKTALKEAIITRQFFPVYCGSSLKNIGVKELMSGISSFLPSPVDKVKLRPLIGVNVNDHTEEIEPRLPTTDSPMSAIVFKTMIDQFSGKLSVVRIFSGELSDSSTIYNGTKKEKEKIGNIYKIQGKNLIKVKKLIAGEIGAISKLSKTHTGDTLCDSEYPIHFHRVKYAMPILSYAVELESGKEEKLSLGLHQLTEEDPTIDFSYIEETHEMILKGMGQTHIEVTLERLKRKFGVTATLKTPKIPYRETIKKTVQVQGKLKKQSGGHGQFAECWMKVEPLERGKGFVFENRITGGVIPRQYIPSVEVGVKDAMKKGILAGYPITDIKVTLFDGKTHSVDSSDYAFQIAGSTGLKEAFKQSGTLLLEPLMEMEIIVPEDSIGEVVRDLNGRRGQVLGLEPKARSQTIRAIVPFSEVLEYGNLLQAMTEGQGLYTMSHYNYTEVSSHLERKILSETEV